MADARIMTGLPSHPKTRKLIRKHGQAAAWNLICLFLFARDNRPDGNFSGMGVDDIELAADWQGRDGEFVQALIDVGFLDQTEDGFEIHDWAEHNPWAAGARQRSESAKQNAAKRWKKRYGTDAVGINPHSEPQDSALQSAEIGNAPSPSPSPSPIPSPSPTPTEGALVVAKPRPSKRAPVDFTLTSEMLEWAWAEAPGVNVTAETAKFMDHTFATAKTDWMATWRNWIRKATPIAAAKPKPVLGLADQVMANFNENQRRLGNDRND